MIISLNKQYFKFKELSSDEILNRLEVIKEDKLTNAGYLSFAKKIRYIPAASIKAARFKGNSMSTFIDMKDFDSNLISAVDDILDFVSRHINMKVVINGDSRRKELWDYPIAALREAVINAVVHRDYADPGNIQVRIFDDIIEVWSPGRLPKEIDICKLLTENRSIPRNRNLARIFYQVGLIENWGTGFHRMAEACRKNGNPLPLFEEKTGAFVITFKKRNGNEGINEGLNKLFFHIATHPGERLTEISNQLDIPKKTLERWIKELKEEEKINFKGSKRNGGYHVSNTASK